MTAATGLREAPLRQSKQKGAPQGSDVVAEGYTWALEMLMKYKIALRETEEGYSVSVPGLPGCWSQGASEAEALANIEAAIREYLAARDELLQGTVVREVDVA